MKFLHISILAITFILASSMASVGQSTQEATQPQIADTAKVITVKTKVKGITCATDLTMISDRVESMKGVSSCKADKAGPTTTFKITFKPALVKEEEIHKIIENTGSCENPNERPYRVKQ